MEGKTYNADIEICFEDFKNQNGIIFWWASEIMLMLGYEDMSDFRKLIEKTTNAFISLGIDHSDNIIYIEHDVNGKIIPDFKLTRFACYMIALNENPQKTEAANMQAYFAVLTRKFELYFGNYYDSDRRVVRDRIKKGNNQSGYAANGYGTEGFTKFCNANYLDKYNRADWQFPQNRRPDNKNPFETKDRSKLAANLFRTSQI